MRAKAEADGSSASQSMLGNQNRKLWKRTAGSSRYGSVGREGTNTLAPETLRSQPERDRENRKPGFVVHGHL